MVMVVLNINYVTFVGLSSGFIWPKSGQVGEGGEEDK